MILDALSYRIVLYELKVNTYLRRIYMATLTNEMGTIQISDDVIAKIAGRSAEGCYGIVGMAAKKASDGLVELLNRENFTRGIRVSSSGEELIIDMYVIVEYGISIFAVSSSAIDTVKYNVENQTGLKVSKVNVTVEGIRVN